MSGSPKPSDAPKTFDQVLHDELMAIELRREAWRRAIQGELQPPGETTRHDLGLLPIDARPVPKDRSPKHQLRRRAFDKGLLGVALSGGGIRSATFCLGVLQTLGKLNLLSRIDYLSTVSGGGYIGGWFSSLLHRTLEADRREVEDFSRAGRKVEPEELRRKVCGKRRGIFRLERELGANQPRLTSEASSTPDPEVENPSISFLRRYSNYLTPRVGFLSIDTWTAVATYLRNLTLNFAILLALTGAFLLVPRFVTTGLIALEFFANASIAALAPLTPVHLLLLLALALTLGATSVIAAGLMDLQEPDSRDGLGPEIVLRRVVAPLLTAAVLLSAALASEDAAEVSLLSWCVNLGASALVVWGLAGLFVCRFWNRRRGRWWPKGWGPWLVSGVVVSGLAAAVLWALAQTRTHEGILSNDWLAAAWAPPLLMLWLVVVGAFQTGLAGTALHDAQREWLNRLGAWLLVTAGAWNLSFLLILVGPPILMSMGPLLRTALVGGWLGTTAAGLLAARTRAGRQSGVIGQSLVLVAPWVFVVGFLLTVALLLDWGVDRAGTVLPSPERPYSWQNWIDASDGVAGELETWQFLHKHDPLAAGAHPPKVFQVVYSQHLHLLDATRASLLEVAVLCLLLLVVALALGWRVDINEFSMHGFYRNRLVRAFLGAARQAARHQNPVTGFSRQDDIQLASLRPDDSDRYFLPRAPIHLINTAVNMVSTEELAWQERQAASFILSPYFCGYEMRDGTHQGYRETTSGFGNEPADLTLGGAVATSGAAVSPNMGFRTSPALAALLTLFNVRLGRWIGNPGDALWRRSGPNFALELLVQEILRGTAQRKEYLYLSDGGHFENLGIYELVRRRCRYIVAVDAGADPEMTFTDLGNAIRKCRIDLRVKIEVDLEPLKKSVEGLSDWHCIVGKIRYPEGDHCVGMLLYLKASLTGDEPADILEYRSVHGDFPHQSTSDQFFDESQFESYRALGRHASQAALAVAVANAMSPINPKHHSGLEHHEQDWPPHTLVDLETMRINLEQRWRAPSHATAEAFTRHAAKLDELFERCRTSPELRFLDPQTYPEWDRLMLGAFTDDEDARGRAGASALRLPNTEEERRAGFYFCSSLIQLMENVYLDLDLASEHDHPDNRGWMNLFNHWTWSPMFRATWSICAATFGRRFQTFCENHLGMNQGTVCLQPLWNEIATRTVSDLEARLEQQSQSDPWLNFVETEQAVLFMRWAAVEEQQPATAILEQAISFRLMVESVDPNESAELLSFGVGYALVGKVPNTDDGRAGHQILLFRIQDHLRHLGLGRKALSALLESSDLKLDGSQPVAVRPIRDILMRLEQTGCDLPAARRFVNEFQGGHVAFMELADSVLAERSNNRRLRE